MSFLQFIVGTIIIGIIFNNEYVHIERRYGESHHLEGMKKYLAIIIAVFMLVGCTPSQTVDKPVNEGPMEATSDQDLMAKTFMYASEKGDIELPTDPQRIVILDSSAAGAILLFDGSVVGHEYWTGTNPLFADHLKNSTEVSVDNLEQIMALSPDLIVASSYNENLEELSAIAPTVAFTYGKLNYTDTIIEYGKLVNKEEEAKKWVEDFKAKSLAVGEKIKAEYGEDVSISVIEAYGEEMYLYGDNWGRGTQIVYQEMGLVMPKPVKEVALSEGYYSISAEVVPEYQADLMIFAYFKGSNMAFTETQTWKNIEAVKNNHVLKVEAEKFYMTGPITLEYQLDQIEEFFVQ